MSATPSTSPSTGPPILAVANLEVVYDDVVLVLRGLSVEVPAGAVVALLGANGAGKTTLLRAVTGLLIAHRGKIVKGSVAIAGEETTGADPAQVVRRGVGQVMEGRRIFAEMTVEENLRAGAHSRPRAEYRESMTRVFDLFPVLAKRRRGTAGYLSGGEQQMLAIGRALMARPRLLLLDEPSLGLAPKLVEQVREIVVQINQQGTSVLLVEQNAVMALSIAHYGYVLEVGKVVRDGPAGELLVDEDIREFYLGALDEKGGETARRRSFAEVKSYRRKKRWSA
ncbi:ABC transporter ATP-binding protein [Actinophytocola sediminis]